MRKYTVFYNKIEGTTLTIEVDPIYDCIDKAEYDTLPEYKYFIFDGTFRECTKDKAILIKLN